MTFPRVIGARLALLLGLLLVAVLVVPAPAAGSSDPVALIRQAIDQARAAAGRAPLDVDGRLVDIASAWTDEQVRRNTMAHNPAMEAEYAWGVSRAGEIVGRSTWPGASDEQMALRIVEAWMASGGHRAQILGDFTDLGIGVGRRGDTLYATVDFVKAPLPANAREALEETRTFFPDGSAQRVVLARADTFADALAGAALAGPDAPVLLARPGRDLAPELAAELQRVAAPGAPVYLLGGPGALPPAVDAQVQALGLAPRRVAGDTRIETAVALAREAVALHGPPDTVLLASASSWADAVTAGAYAAWAGLPVLLTEPDHLHGAVAAFLDAHRPVRVVAVGGPAALSDAVVQAAGAERVAGDDRVATSVAVARELWGRTDAQAGHHFGLMPARATDGWAAALIHASWAARHHAPLLLVGEELPPVVRGYLADTGYSPATPAWFEPAFATSATAVEQARAAFGGG